MSEDVITNMQEILGEALANYSADRQRWCYTYMEQMRKIILDKFDCISAHVLEYIEEYTKYTPQELEELKNKANRRNDSTIKDTFTLTEKTKDVRLGVYGCVIPKN